MKTLAIMRHAVAGRAGRDYDRPLEPRGREQAALQAARMKKAIGRVDIAVTSGAARTRETLEAMRSGGLEVGREVQIGSLYAGSWRQALKEIQAIDPEANTVLVIGHEPTVSVMAAMLSKEGNRSLSQLSFGFSAAQFVWGEVEEWATLGKHTYDVVGIQRPAM